MIATWKYSQQELETILREEAVRARATISDVAYGKASDVLPPWIAFTLDCPFPPHLGILLQKRHVKMAWDGGRSYRAMND